ncbi:cytochrome P450 [Mycena olivaceomarginata]|nr:cytochrome P450 [Mycena olivaceomarginata]
MNSVWVVAALLAFWFIWQRKSKTQAGALPPGPTPVPILGNVRDLTAKELWLTATKWAKEFGKAASPFYSREPLTIGSSLIVWNSPEATMDLLDRKGSIYGDKPSLVMAGELCGCESMVAFTRYGESSRRQRKLINQAFGIQVIPSYHPLIEAETHSFIRSLVADPSNYIDHTRRYAGGLTLSVIYGYEAVGNNDKFLNLGEECVDILSNRIASGGGIGLPTWAPGSGFLLKAAQWKAKMEEFVDHPYNFVKASMKTGSYVPSFCSVLLEDKEKCNTQFEFDLKWTANSMYSASMDTTITVFCHFLLAMVLHPEVLAKAQKEIDTVVGRDRLPTFSDRASLPFVEALLSETYRWGLPHRLMEDDVYRGMFIPKGSLIFGNVWAITRDETLFPNASAFLPERYLEKVDPALAKKRDPPHLRIWVNLVESSVWLLITAVLATLDISKAKDDFGNPIEPKIDFNNSVFRIPDKFQCDIRPRSEHALKVLREADAARP